MRRVTALAVGILLAVFAACAVQTEDTPAPSAPYIEATALLADAEHDPAPYVTLISTPEPTPTPPPYTDEELYAVALTLSGECYDDQEQDKRNVAWVICNRVRDGRFGSGIVGVVSSKEYGIQFVGYWRQSRPISDNDRDIAREVLTAYFNDEQAPHEYLYFSGGTGKTNKFR